MPRRKAEQELPRSSKKAKREPEPQPAHEFRDSDSSLDDGEDGEGGFVALKLMNHVYSKRRRLSAMQQKENAVNLPFPERTFQFFTKWKDTKTDKWSEDQYDTWEPHDSFGEANSVMVNYLIRHPEIVDHVQLKSFRSAVVAKIKKMAKKRGINTDTVVEQFRADNVIAPTAKTAAPTSDDDIIILSTPAAKAKAAAHSQVKVSPRTDDIEQFTSQPKASTSMKPISKTRKPVPLKTADKARKVQPKPLPEKSKPLSQGRAKKSPKSPPKKKIIPSDSEEDDIQTHQRDYAISDPIEIPIDAEEKDAAEFRLDSDEELAGDARDDAAFQRTIRSQAEEKSRMQNTTANAKAKPKSRLSELSMKRKKHVDRAQTEEVAIPAHVADLSRLPNLLTQADLTPAFVDDTLTDAGIAALGQASVPDLDQYDAGAFSDFVDCRGPSFVTSADERKVANAHLNGRPSLNLVEGSDDGPSIMAPVMATKISNESSASEKKPDEDMAWPQVPWPNLPGNTGSKEKTAQPVSSTIGNFLADAAIINSDVTRPTNRLASPMPVRDDGMAHNDLFSESGSSEPENDNQPSPISKTCAHCHASGCAGSQDPSLCVQRKKFNKPAAETRRVKEIDLVTSPLKKAATSTQSPARRVIIKKRADEKTKGLPKVIKNIKPVAIPPPPPLGEIPVTEPGSPIEEFDALFDGNDSTLFNRGDGPISAFGTVRLAKSFGRFLPDNPEKEDGYLFLYDQISGTRIMPGKRTGERKFWTPLRFVEAYWQFGENLGMDRSAVHELFSGKKICVHAPTWLKDISKDTKTIGADVFALQLLALKNEATYIGPEYDDVTSVFIHTSEVTRAGDMERLLADQTLTPLRRKNSVQFYVFGTRNASPTMPNVPRPVLFPIWNMGFAITFTPDAIISDIPTFSAAQSACSENYPRLSMWFHSAIIGQGAKLALSNTDPMHINASTMLQLALSKDLSPSCSLLHPLRSPAAMAGTGIAGPPVFPDVSDIVMVLPDATDEILHADTEFTYSTPQALAREAYHFATKYFGIRRWFVVTSMFEECIYRNSDLKFPIEVISSNKIKAIFGGGK